MLFGASWRGASSTVGGEGVHDRSPDVNTGRIEPDKTYNRSTFTSADWSAFVVANSIDLTRFTFTP